MERNTTIDFQFLAKIIITFKGKDNNGDTDTLYICFAQDEPLYPLAEMLLGKYEKRKELESLIKQGFISHIEPLK